MIMNGIDREIKLELKQCKYESADRFKMMLVIHSCEHIQQSAHTIMSTIKLDEPSIYK